MTATEHFNKTAKENKKVNPYPIDTSAIGGAKLIGRGTVAGSAGGTAGALTGLGILKLLKIPSKMRLAGTLATGVLGGGAIGAGLSGAVYGLSRAEANKKKNRK